MIEAFLVAKLGEKVGRVAAALLPYLAAGLVVLGFVLWIHGMQAKIAKQAGQITTLQTDLATEQQARQRDVAGLTSLSSGLLAASSAKDKDQAALQETIDATHPAPVSPGLAALLGCLRAADSGKECTAAARAGGSPAPAAAGSH